ncbi:hypothetical protein [Clostridium tetani]|uniref:hypothetical protein n=1 Tax=Clostridium tetani TaxID=1513 RepID=UPI00100BD2C3|nr:hypothetical protein [Clostridium tetani]RXM57305.1 hypothetical protein DP133_09335 [Clostridium tetani]RXM77175.1 hypothetical protein DP154_06475 [Clostridium tetani]RYU99420.1 hypothetical protein DP144_06485 [Clostridium tetani]
MAIDYAVKYSGAVDEKFKAISKSNQCINNDFDFTGSKAVKVYSVNTAKMNDYSRETVEGSRYGVIENLSTTTQEMILSKDRSFTFAIDRMDMDETAMALESGKALERQLREVVVPEVDTYRFAKICEGAGTKATPSAITKENVYDKITTGTEILDDKEVPQEGRFLVVTPKVYKTMKNSKDIAMETEIGQEMRIKGIVAIYDGMPIIKVPSNRLPKEAGFLIGHPSAACSPVKLAEYKIHDNPQGISGYLIEGRVYYDAFVLNNKKDALYYHSISTTTP